MDAARTDKTPPASHHETSVSHHEMHGHAPLASTDYWVFNAEAVATLLIAAWYVLGVLIVLGIVPDGGFFPWGSRWVIPMLLGVFYLGSGYLFQRHQQVCDFSAWRANMAREAIVLLTPFLAFTVLTLLTASLAALEPELARRGLAVGVPVFSVPALLDALFVHPVGPVGYFIVLLGLFALARTPRTVRGMAAMLALAALAKVIAIVLADAGTAPTMPYYLMQMADNGIWFALGVALRFFGLERALARVPVAVGAAALFLAGGALLCALGITEAAVLFALALLGIASLYALSAVIFMDRLQVRFFGFVTRYTMAIWLMHEILSKVVFCALFALGFSPVGSFADVWVPVCATACLISCYGLPILVMNGLSRAGKLGFIVYPARYLPPSAVPSPSASYARTA